MGARASAVWVTAQEHRLHDLQNLWGTGVLSCWGAELGGWSPSGWITTCQGLGSPFLGLTPIPYHGLGGSRAVRTWLLVQHPGVLPCPGKGELGTLRRPEPEQDKQVSDYPGPKSQVCCPLILGPHRSQAAPGTHLKNNCKYI